MNGIQMEGRLACEFCRLFPLIKEPSIGSAFSVLWRRARGHSGCTTLQCTHRWVVFAVCLACVLLLLLVNIEGGGISASSSLHHMQSSRKLKSTFSGYGAILLSFFCIWRPRNSFNGGLVRKGLPGYHNYYENFYWQDSRFLNNRFRQKIKL